MSQEEQMLVVGRTVAEYAECKKKLAALLAEAKRIGRVMQTCSTYLSSEEPIHSGTLYRGDAPPDLAGLPVASDLAALIEDARSTRKRLQELRKAISEFGIETRD